MSVNAKVITKSLDPTPLKLASSAEEYALHKAALEWNLREPIILESEADFTSRPRWTELVKPFWHQNQNLVTFCRRLPVTLLADDVGLGKTISAGLIISELMQRKHVSKVLIVCPKILLEQWEEELQSKFAIKSWCEVGAKNIRRRIEELRHEPEGVLLTTYNSAVNSMEELKTAGFEMLILDEAHKLCTLYRPQGKPPQRAVCFRKVLGERTFKYVLMLTATPIQNCLWDLYSLIDILAVVRGHQNPFGSEDSFTRRYIADSRTEARKLNPKNAEEFRSIVYDYMSRVRRDDARLLFPKREIWPINIQPTQPEVELLRLIIAHRKILKGYAPVSLAKALVSSPQAFVSELNTMAEKNPNLETMYNSAVSISARIGCTAKLDGFGSLIEKLKKERPRDWRLVVYTEFINTQSAIGEYLESRKVPYAFINGGTARQNPETIKKFKANPPDINVIVSTSAGSEGLNLQAANVLLNYDLPWNPMKVEQRVGRIQRLGSAHAKVEIVNATLEGTFEEKIVARLMVKLQLAAHAIGDIESLLEGVGSDDEDGSSKFEEILSNLVLASLEGKDVERDTKLKLASIDDAEKLIASEEKNINTLLGTIGSSLDKGPKAPRLSAPERSMSVKEFVLASFRKSGTEFSEVSPGIYSINTQYTSKKFVFDQKDAADLPSDTIIYMPGKPQFDVMVTAHTNKNECFISGLDSGIGDVPQSACRDWVTSFGGVFSSARDTAVANNFSGKAVLRVNISVAHDRYEKLVEVSCSGAGGTPQARGQKNAAIDPATLGINLNELSSAAVMDQDIREFCRFYLQRLEEELGCAGDDVRMREKLTTDFTPKLQPSLVGLDGCVKREIKFEIGFSIEGSPLYKCEILVDHETGALLNAPPIETCEYSSLRAPATCFQSCAVSNKWTLKHRLVKSAVSESMALPEHIKQCSFTSKSVLSTELGVSDLTGKLVLIPEMKISAVSNKRGEPSFFGQCSFTRSDVLETELETSQVSGKRFRSDEGAVSAVSLKRGHKNEFKHCAHTGKWLVPDEGEKCEVSGSLVVPGILKRCEVTHKQVLPTLLGECAVTGKKVLSEFLVPGSISKVFMLKTEALASSRGSYCHPKEGVACSWDSKIYHPDDISYCALSGLPISKEYLFGQVPSLKGLIELLNRAEGEISVPGDLTSIVSAISHILGQGQYKIVSISQSPAAPVAAVVVESEKWYWLKKRRHGFVYEMREGRIVGKVATGKLNNGIWAKV